MRGAGDGPGLPELWQLSLGFLVVSLSCAGPRGYLTLLGFLGSDTVGHAHGHQDSRLKAQAHGTVATLHPRGFVLFRALDPCLWG